MFIHSHSSSQLNQVDATLLACAKGSAEWDSLQNLRSDLTELLELTRESLCELGGSSGGGRNDDKTIEDDDDDLDPFADEMNLFMAEIQKEDISDDNKATSTTTSADEKFKILKVYFLFKIFRQPA